MIIGLLRYLSTIAVFAVVGFPLAVFADRSNPGTTATVIGALMVITAGVWWWAVGFDLLLGVTFGQKQDKVMRREGDSRIPPSRPLEQTTPHAPKPDQLQIKTWLATQADEISQGLLAGASRCLTDLKATLPADKKLDPAKEWEVVAEYMFFLLHSCDRVAFGVLSLADRDAFMGHLADLTLNRFTQAYISATGGAEDAEQLRKEVLRAAMDRHSEYGSYKSEPAEGEGLRGTLLWEFGKRIAQVIGLHPSDATANYTAVTLATAYLNALDLEKRLTPS